MFLSTINISIAQEINIGTRDTLYSAILEEERPLSIYFPPSYNYKTERNYPVLYILDGNYDFQYVAGLLELQAGIAENIPEMILVGISGKGSKIYKKNCKPDIQGIEDSGNADKVLEFLEKELIPYIDNNYKTLDYNVLAGHSIGGLFIINAALKKPQLFKDYIAISPALWWEENAINIVAKKTYKVQDSIKSNTYVSLANEKRMGVKEFLELVGPEFKFKQFEHENHNSVGAPTYEWALKDIFKVWKNDKKYFESADELVKYQSLNSSNYDVSLPVSEAILYNTVIYILNDKPEELEKIRHIISENYPGSEAYFITLLATIHINAQDFQKARDLLLESLKLHPESFELYEKLAEVDLHLEEKKRAKEKIQKALGLAKDQGVRQWRIDEIKALKEKLKN
ncbi:alpha/beta hydrolase-fold protein [Christiangramia salexigens]|uniref:Uncharacterized protein n=1 Tax=Christiangramia salexigens TaxID=1913577 RepID=A0A1L3J432_9FLAO|nr:alpha/beta hydrolase-fold protein [Christiangramia salexigens]APG59876.1 hypothetical protein LPB144_05360 [Christiangramia salexigens]